LIDRFATSFIKKSYRGFLCVEMVGDNADYRLNVIFFYFKIFI